MFENPRGGRQARNFKTNVSKILDLKSSSEQMYFRKLSLGAPVKILDARQLDILTVLSLKSFSASAESTRFVCKIIKSL